TERRSPTEYSVQFVVASQAGAEQEALLLPPEPAPPVPAPPEADPPPAPAPPVPAPPEAAPPSVPPALVAIPSLPNRAPPLDENAFPPEPKGASPSPSPSSVGSSRPFS